MGRIKKRIIKKKANIKKNIKLSIKRKPQQTERKITAEQQAKQNEMLKVMLARPQQILPQGAVQQNDDLKQKIDTLTRRNTEMINQQISDRNAIAQLQRTQQDIRNEHAQQRQLQQQQEIQAEADERLANERVATDRLRRANAALNFSTEEGQIRQRISELETQEHDANIRREDQQAAMKNKLLYQELLRKQADVNSLNEQVNALQTIIDSNEFKNPNEALKEAYENEMKQKIKKK